MLEIPVPGAALNCCSQANLGAIAAGPDGNLWFADGQLKVGRVTTSGSITEFAVPSTGQMTAGWDGNIWMIAPNSASTRAPDAILRITPTGALTKYELALSSDPTAISVGPSSITVGPDGNIWFTEAFTNQVGRIEPGGAIDYFPLQGGNGPTGIVTGPDHNLWIGEIANPVSAIDRMTPDGTVTVFPVGGTLQDPIQPLDLVVGPDSNIWFTANGRIGRMSMNGDVTLFPIPPQHQCPTSLAVGPDRNLWFTCIWEGSIGRVSLNGTLRFFPLARRDSAPTGIAAGSDGRVWFTESGLGNIGNIGVTVPEANSARAVTFAGGSPTTRTLTITNTGDGELTVDTTRIAGIDAALFTKTRDTCSGATLQMTKTCQVEVTFATGAPPGLRAAFLQVSDNATASPQQVSLVAGLPACTLPVIPVAPQGLAQGEYLNLATGVVTAAVGGGFQGDTGASGARTSASPSLSGNASGYFDRQAGRWLPVSSGSQVSPDGSRYAYTIGDPMGGGPSAVHVVEVSNGSEKVLPVSQGYWRVVAFTAQGIYLNQGFEGTGPGLWLLDPDTGVMTSVFTDAAVAFISGDEAWLAVRNTADPLPGPGGIGPDRNEIQERDLATGVTSTSLYVSGTDMWVVGVSGGDPIISVRVTGSITYWTTTAAGAAQPMQFPFTPDNNLDGFVDDQVGEWVGSPDGVYLWTPRTQGVLVSGVAASPAGACG